MPASIKYACTPTPVSKVPRAVGRSRRPLVGRPARPPHRPRTPEPDQPKMRTPSRLFHLARDSCNTNASSPHCVDPESCRLPVPAQAAASRRVMLTPLLCPLDLKNCLKFYKITTAVKACLGHIVHQDALLQGSSTVDDGRAYHIHRNNDAQLGPDLREHSHEPHQVYSNQFEQQCCWYTACGTPQCDVLHITLASLPVVEVR